MSVVSLPCIIVDLVSDMRGRLESEESWSNSPRRLRCQLITGELI
jgi:hypothetical protein